MDNYRVQEPFAKNGLYDPRFEHENCGIGAVVNLSGKPDNTVVDNALKIVETLEHRAGKDAEGKTGDGVVIHVLGNWRLFVQDGLLNLFFLPINVALILK